MHFDPCLTFDPVTVTNPKEYPEESGVALRNDFIFTMATLLPKTVRPVVIQTGVLARVIAASYHEKVSF